MRKLQTLVSEKDQELNELRKTHTVELEDMNSELSQKQRILHYINTMAVEALEGKLPSDSEEEDDTIPDDRSSSHTKDGGDVDDGDDDESDRHESKEDGGGGGEFRCVRSHFDVFHVRKLCQLYIKTQGQLQEAMEERAEVGEQLSRLRGSQSELEGQSSALEAALQKIRRHRETEKKLTGLLRTATAGLKRRETLLDRRLRTLRLCLRDAADHWITIRRPSRNPSSSPSSSASSSAAAASSTTPVPSPKSTTAEENTESEKRSAAGGGEEMEIISAPVERCRILQRLSMRGVVWVLLQVEDEENLQEPRNGEDGAGETVSDQGPVARAEASEETPEDGKDPEKHRRPSTSSSPAPNNPSSDGNQLFWTKQTTLLRRFYEALAGQPQPPKHLIPKEDLDWILAETEKNQEAFLPWEIFVREETPVTNDRTDGSTPETAEEEDVEDDEEEEEEEEFEDRLRDMVIPELLQRMLQRRQQLEFTSKWRSGIQRFTRELEDLRTELDTAREEKQALEQAYTQYKARAHNLLQSQETQLSEAQHRITELGQLRDELESLRAERSAAAAAQDSDSQLTTELRLRLEQAEEAVSQAEYLRDQAETSRRQELQAWAERCQALEAEVRDSESRHREEIRSLEQRLEEERKALQERFQAQRLRARGMLEQKDEEIETLRRRLQEGSSGGGGGDGGGGGGGSRPAEVYSRNSLSSSPSSSRPSSSAAAAAVSSVSSSSAADPPIAIPSLSSSSNRNGGADLGTERLLKALETAASVNVSSSRSSSSSSSAAANAVTGNGSGGGDQIMKLAEVQALRDDLLHGLRHHIQRLQNLLHEKEIAEAQARQRETELETRLTELEQSLERQQTMDKEGITEYLKNVLVRYMSSRGREHEALFPAISTVLQLSQEDIEIVKRGQEEQQQTPAAWLRRGLGF